MPTPEEIRTFQNTIFSYFRTNKRVFPWRYETDPYKILVSEVMLQQTQVSRVIPKYQSFLKGFPTIQHLAEASLSDVLREWQGMGYNRRGKYLHDTSRAIVDSFSGIVPDTVESLVDLPGIGPNTAGAIISYAFNKPAPFIETNIRSVYLYFFFAGEHHVTDQALLTLVTKTMDTSRPRDWFYALTDYGVYLKTTEKFKNTQSKHYAKQSAFEGSRRQIRGKILSRASVGGLVLVEDIAFELNREPSVVCSVISDMEREGLIEKSSRGWKLKDA